MGLDSFRRLGRQTNLNLPQKFMCILLSAVHQVFADQLELVVDPIWPRHRRSQRVLESCGEGTDDAAVVVAVEGAAVVAVLFALLGVRAAHEVVE